MGVLWAGADGSLSLARLPQPTQKLAFSGILAPQFVQNILIPFDDAYTSTECLRGPDRSTSPCSC